MRTITAVCALFCLMAFQIATISCGVLGSVDDHPGLPQAQAVCKAKNNVNDDVYKRAINQDLQGDDKNLQCYAQCILTATHIMDQAGMVDFTNFVNNMKPKSKQFYGPILIGCQKTVGDEADLCLKSMKIYQCTASGAKENYYFV